MLGWLLRYAWWRTLRKPGPAISTLTVGGLRLTLDWAAAEHVALREIIGRGEYWPASAFRPGPGQTVVDVGANAGVFSVVAGSRIGPSGRLIAVEPNPAVATRLRRNVRQNGLDDRSVIVEVGLSDHVGQARLHVGANSTVGTVVPTAGPSSPSIEIRLDTLDDLARTLGFPRVDLLKIDVEGLEHEVLDGSKAVLADCARLVIEVSADADVPGVIERCRRAGFGTVQARNAGIDSGATIVFADRSEDGSAGESS